ncbi:cytochrome P450 [Planosporangium flavigriseum]|uniref:Cytochrome P450 n=1 Tax=Planosporangium flavigriseum TaxID=373681 RepID=A0A8J3LLS7_9ACTN|nr:cytochrome P450 [Planosporangium flavigriseum]GIG75057.1 cytochrome P450 [Planosporangium flavigriseum]
MRTTTASLDAPFLDVTDPKFRFDSPAVAEARELSWYAKTPLGLLVLRYAEAQGVLRDLRFAPSGERYLALQGISEGPLYDWFVSIILHRTGDDHLRLRRLVTKAFTPRMMEGFRPFMRDRASQLAERIAARTSTTGECEFMDEFADPLPVAVMCELLGVPAEDYHLFRRWSTDVGLVFSFNLADVHTRAEAAVIGLYEYLDRLIALRRAEPRDDLLSALIAAEETGDRLSTDELRNLAVALVFAAHDTTRNQLGHAMVAFAAHPDQWHLLGKRPELATQAVEEVMRWAPTVPTTFRFALEDVQLNGVDLPAGSFVLVCAQAANRDPRVFPGGSRLDITRQLEAAHLTFGGGPHYCLGAATARTEIAAALSVLTSRFDPPSHAGPVAWRAPTGLYGPERLPLRFTVREK